VQKMRDILRPFFIILFCLSLGSAFSSPAGAMERSYNYYLPYLSTVGNDWTGLALANGSKTSRAPVTVTVYDENGNVLQTIDDKILEIDGQEAFPVVPPTAARGWILVNSHQPLTGLAFLGKGNLELMADISFVSEPATELVIPHIAQSTIWDTTVLICNPQARPVTVRFRHITPEGIVEHVKTYPIPAHGSTSCQLAATFATESELAGSISISASGAVVAFALYGDTKSGGSYYAGINAVPGLAVQSRGVKENSPRLETDRKKNNSSPPELVLFETIEYDSNSVQCVDTFISGEKSLISYLVSDGGSESNTIITYDVVSHSTLHERPVNHWTCQLAYLADSGLLFSESCAPTPIFLTSQFEESQTDLKESKFFVSRDKENIATFNHSSSSSVESISIINPDNFKGIGNSLEYPIKMPLEGTYCDLEASWSNDNMMLAITEGYESSHLWLYKIGISLEKVEIDGLSGSYSPVFFNNDEYVAFGGGYGDGSISIVSTKTLQEVRRINAFSHYVFALEVSSDGKYLIAGGYDGILKIFDTTTFEEVYAPINTGPIIDIVLSADQNHLIVTIGGGRNAAAVKIFTGLGSTRWYRDGDGDGYGDMYIYQDTTNRPLGYVINSSDCDDSNSDLHPGATEICGDGIDQDCNGSDLICPGDYTPGPYNYYLPSFESGIGNWTGLALSNAYSGVTTDLKVMVYGPAGGTPLYEDVKNLPAGGQSAFVVAAGVTGSGWIYVNSHQALAGLAFVGENGTPLLMADIPFVSELNDYLVVPHIAQQDGWETIIFICNPHDQEVTVTLTNVNPVGATSACSPQNRELPAHGSASYLLSDLFAPPLSGKIYLRSTSGIAAFALYKNPNPNPNSHNIGRYYSGINAVPAAE